MIMVINGLVFLVIHSVDISCDHVGLSRSRVHVVNVELRVYLEFFFSLPPSRLSPSY